MLHKTDTNAFRDKWTDHIYSLQEKICRALETVDGKSVFMADEWDRKGGGGGLTRTIEQGKVFEKGGVNSSVVWGKVSHKMRSQLDVGGSQWFAAGLSLVLHPQNPYVPTVHANWRYFELYDEAGYVADRWFGGGSDLTPYYIFEDDVRHFHLTLKNAIDPFGDGLYQEYKGQCDAYFVNKHRDNEMRGVGGVFFDHLHPADEPAAERWLAFQIANGNAFGESYLPIVERRKDLPFGDREVLWQEIRRGRYVEFNLLHDRGTLFGLQTNGRTESILMSLPPRARWMYNYRPAGDTPEAALLESCLHPRDWV
jgi:coproporphyrinogen III oxidase